MGSLFDYKNDSDYPYNKRVFVTLCKPTSGSLYGVEGGPRGNDFSGSAQLTPIRTSITGGFAGNEAFRTEDLAELGTFEVVGYQEVTPITNGDNSSTNERINALIPSSNFELNQQFINKQSSSSNHGGSFFHENQQAHYLSGSYVVSMCQDDNPSLLVELNKNQQLPDGIGDKEFVVIPDNLHPFIKDNLSYFLTKGGVNVGGDTSNLIELDLTNYYLDQPNKKPDFNPAPITPQIRAAKRAVLEANKRRFELPKEAPKIRIGQEDELTRRERRQERRNERREDRQERRNERREDRQERRNERRENRYDRREERQNRRRNRRNRRRNR